MTAHSHDRLTEDLSTQSLPTAGVPERTALAAALALPARLWREVQLRRATRKLEGMDDRMLGDIGISRADIEGAVRAGRRYPLPYL